MPSLLLPSKALKEGLGPLKLQTAVCDIDLELLPAPFGLCKLLLELLELPDDLSELGLLLS